MHKVTKILLAIICFLLIVYFCLTKYIEKSENMEELIGARIGSIELSVADYYSLSQYAQAYIDYLKEKDYDKAYSITYYKYREYLSYEKFLAHVEEIDYSEAVIADIIPITRSTYKSIIDINGKTEIITLLVNDLNQTVMIFPDSFLKYEKQELKKSNKKIECVLKDYIVNVDCIKFHFTIINNNKSEIRIDDSMLITNYEDKINSTINEAILPGETKNIEIVFSTNYSLPKNVLLQCIINEKKVELEYEFKK